MKTDVELLDAVKAEFDFANDCQLFDLLSMSRTQISGVRAKTNPRSMTNTQPILAYNHLGYAWAREAMLALFPEELHQKWRAMDIKKTKAVASREKSAKKPAKVLSPSV